MKKILMISLIASALFSGTAALADDASYSKTDNKVSGITGDTYKTVLITKDGYTNDDGIYYVDQTDSGTFGAGTEFLLKATPDNGLYNISLGGNGSAPVKSSFIITDSGSLSIGTSSVSDNVFKEAAGSEDKQNISYVWEAVKGADVKSIVLQLGEKAYVSALTDTDFGDTGSEIAVGITIIGVPETQEDMNAYLSSKEISDFTVTSKDGE